MRHRVVALLVIAACGGSSASSIEDSTITIDPVRVLADGRTKAEVIVTLRGADGVAQSGRSVELIVNDATLIPSTATTDEDGVVLASLVSATGGMKTVTASGGGIELVAEVVFDAVPPPCATEQRFPYPAPPPTTAISVADLNGDGIPDALGVRGFNDNEETGALLGRGDGTFDKLPPVKVFGDEYVRRSVLVDLDNDGNLDFVNVRTFGGGLLLHRGDGTGHFAQPANVDGGPFNIDFNNAPLAFGDFDDDDVIDVASIAASNVVTRKGNGDGTFQSPVATALTKPLAPVSDMFAGDFNEDGRADLAIADPADATIHVAHANVDGTFDTPIAIVTTLSESDMRRLRVVDTDGDGDADLFVRTAEGVVVIRSQGDGTFAPAASISIPLIAEAEFLLPEVQIADIDRDGIPDLFASAGKHFIMLAGNGDGTFDAPSMIPGGDEAFTGGVTVADFNVDGFPDVLTSVVLLYDGERFGPKVESLEVADKLFGTAIVDLDRDGHPDVLSNVVVGTFFDVAAEGALTSFRGRGDATFEAPLTSASSRPVLRTSILREGLGDFDRDGDPDLVTATAAGIDIYLNDGGLALASSIPIGDALDRRAIVADFDGDRRLDIFVATSVDSDVTYVLLRGDGHGSFSEPVSAFDVDITDPRLATISVGDLDGDGNADLVIESFQKFVVAKGRRDDTLQVFGSIDQFHQSAGLADVDGDGILDLVMTGGDVPGAFVQAHKGVGDGNFSPLSGQRVDLTTTSKFNLADIDRDGTIDSIHESGTIVHSVLDPTGVFQLAAQAVGDLDHDGMLDMVSEPRIGRQICAP